MSKVVRIAAWVAGLLLALAGHSSMAGDGQPEAEPARLVLTGGYGHKIAVYGLGAGWPLPFAAEALARYGLEPRLGADLAQWQGRDHDAANRTLWDADITPYLRWRPGEGSWHGAFAEIGIGFHLLSHTTINESRDLSTAFQFGERLALGFNFGDRNRYEATVFIQHVSNGGIKEPNNGFTYSGATIGIPFD